MKPADVRRQRGFTLIELSVVLLIIAIVISMSATMGISVISTARQSATQRKMKIINDALMQYRTVNDRLPCPGDLTLAPGSADYGLEAGADSGSAIATGTGVCRGASMLPQANFTGSGATNAGATGAEGAVPAVSLGLSPDLMLDGWGNKLRYAVDTAYTARGYFAGIGTGCINGAITVKDANANARSTGSLYALISHGANGHGAYTPSGATLNAGSVNTNELANCHCTSAGAAASYAPTYVQMNATQDHTNALNGFDDLVTYKERWQLRTDWDKAGSSCGMAIYVTDDGNQRVEKFDASGNFLLGIGAGYQGVGGSIGQAGWYNGWFWNVGGIAVDASGNTWVSDGNDGRVEKFNSSGTWLASLSGTGSACTSCLCTASSCPNDSGSGNGQFDYPGFSAVDASGNLYVADQGNDRVQKFDSNGNYLLQFGSPGTGNGQFNDPIGIAIDKNNHVWVVDNNSTCCGTTNDRVEEFDSSGTYLGQFGGRGSGNGQFHDAWGIAIDNSGNIWVADTANNRVQEFDGNGTYLSQFGTYGSGNGQMCHPTAIAFDASNNLYVADNCNNRVQVFNSSGTYLSQFGTSGSGNGQFNQPTDIVISGR